MMSSIKIVAISPATGCEIELEIHRTCERFNNGAHGLVGQQRTAEIGVQHRAGKIEDSAQTALRALRQQNGGLTDDLRFVARGVKVGPALQNVRTVVRRRRRYGVSVILQPGVMHSAGLQVLPQPVERGTHGGEHLGAAVFGEQRLHGRGRHDSFDGGHTCQQRV
jgi:hypothetical protein